MLREELGLGHHENHGNDQENNPEDENNTRDPNNSENIHDQRISSYVPIIQARQVWQCEI